MLPTLYPFSFLSTISFLFRINFNVVFKNACVYTVLFTNFCLNFYVILYGNGAKVATYSTYNKRQRKQISLPNEYSVVFLKLQTKPMVDQQGIFTVKCLLV